MPTKVRNKELYRFLIVGFTAVAVDYATYNILLNIINTAMAKGISFICGSVVGFILNKFYTFEKKAFLISEIIKYAVLYSCTALINAGINSLVLYIFGHKLLAFLCATGVSTVLNFIGQKFIVFK